jgi:hypothetical protein
MGATVKFILLSCIVTISLTIFLGGISFTDRVLSFIPRLLDTGRLPTYFRQVSSFLIGPTVTILLLSYRITISLN